MAHSAESDCSKEMIAPVKSGRSYFGSPVWVRLWHIPLELYSQKGLGYLASAIGKQNLEYAKVCVEVSAKSELPDSILVDLGMVSLLIVDGGVGSTVGAPEIASGDESLKGDGIVDSSVGTPEIVSGDGNLEVDDITISVVDIASGKRGAVHMGVGASDGGNYISEDGDELSIVKEVYCFHVSFVYGHNGREERLALWKELVGFKVAVGDRPWALVGDFNIINCPQESSDFDGSQVITGAMKDSSGEMIARVKQAAMDLKALIMAEECFFRQKSRVQFVKEGDQILLSSLGRFKSSRRLTPFLAYIIVKGLS
ncbi:hypothetical protein V6N13_040910 [Hibiscus sabdariffa]